MILERVMKTISSQLKIQCLNEPVIQGFSNWNVCFHYLFCSSIRSLCRRPTRHAVVVDFTIIFGSDDLEKGIVFKCSSEKDWNRKKNPINLTVVSLIFALFNSLDFLAIHMENFTKALKNEKILWGNYHHRKPM